MTDADDRAALDAQLKFSDILADFQHWRDANATASARIDEGGFERVAYGEDERQWVEVTGNAGDADLLPVFIHGGYWRALEAADHRFFVAALARSFGAAVNVEYRLMPGARMADLVSDAGSAVSTAAGLTGEGRRLLVIGHSAGGHLACFGSRAAADRVAGTVPVSGLADLVPIRGSFLQDELHLTDDEVRDFSPLDPANHPVAPCWTLTGADETPLFHDHANRLARVSGGTSSRVVGTHHMSVLHKLGASETFMRALAGLPRREATPAVID